MKVLLNLISVDQKRLWRKNKVLDRSAKYEAVLRKGKLRYMPKKLLKQTKISINRKYTFNATIWIPNTPESNLKPGVVLKFQHNDQEVRLCFNNAADMVIAIDDLRHFVGTLAPTVHLKHEEAVREWLDFHEAQLSPPINDYTILTVIQDKRDGVSNEEIDNKSKSD